MSISNLLRVLPAKLHNNDHYVEIVTTDPSVPCYLSGLSSALFQNY